MEDLQSGQRFDRRVNKLVWRSVSKGFIHVCSESVKRRRAGETLISSL